MGSRKRDGNPNTGTAEPTTKRRRRRRNIRTADVSSSSSSSDSDSDSDGSIGGNGSDGGDRSKRSRQPANRGTPGDGGEVPMEDAPPLAPPESDGSSDESDQDGRDDEKAPSKRFTEKNRMPSPLRQLHDPLADARFQEYYVRQLTAEFGDELDALRSAKDFGGGGSLAMLVRALKLGVNIFDPAQKRLVVNSVAAKD